jgi:hypothetical protein
MLIRGLTWYKLLDPFRVQHLLIIPTFSCQKLFCNSLYVNELVDTIRVEVFIGKRVLDRVWIAKFNRPTLSA